MARKILFMLLFVALVLELGLTMGSFFAQSFTLSLFKVAETPDTSFLSFIIGWLCLFISAIICLTGWKLWKKREDAYLLCYIMGFFWICIGIAIYAGFGKPDNLAMDSVKGLFIIIAAYFSKKQASAALILN